LTGDRLFDVREYGARGDGKHVDSEAINRAIAAAGRAGGGTVIVPPGRYLCFSIRLRSNLTLIVAEGAVIEAADPARHEGSYDDPEPGPDQLYQDFGHSHWHNSLIHGTGLRNIEIFGPGQIEGSGLTRDGPGARWARQSGERPLSMAGMSAAEIAALESTAEAMVGRGNKAIALRECRDVSIRDLTILKGGHFAILATGCERIRIENLMIDTDRDGINLDCVRSARVANCRVNSPNDDAIVLKSSYALGRAIATEDVHISSCAVSGYDFGTMLNGTFGRTQQLAPDRDRVTGRIKLGTESNGGFRNIRIDNCRFDRSRGIAIETVDGGIVENVAVESIVMNEVTTAPLFLRLGDRRRGPEGTGAGAMRGVMVRGLEALDVDPRFAATIAGLSAHKIEEVHLSDLRLVYARGCEIAAQHREPPPELADAYPEPSMFGITPASGLWVRHVRGLTMERVSLENSEGDPRPAMLFDDVEEVTLDGQPMAV
jgi:polygalacturonase